MAKGQLEEAHVIHNWYLLSALKTAGNASRRNGTMLEFLSVWMGHYFPAKTVGTSNCVWIILLRLNYVLGNHICCVGRHCLGLWRPLLLCIQPREPISMLKCSCLFNHFLAVLQGAAWREFEKNDTSAGLGEGGGQMLAQRAKHACVLKCSEAKGKCVCCSNSHATLPFASSFDHSLPLTIGASRAQLLLYGRRRMDETIDIAVEQVGQ